jgi:EAL domain-containing protein (putative c-di-GMP-specific phosphodiesterase class I)
MGSLPVSTGIALYPDAGTTGAELLAHAQTALELAQASAGEAYRIYCAADDPAHGEEKLHEALRRAWRDGRLRLQFQPCVDLANGRVIGAEALLRWRDPVLGEVVPTRLVAAAESCGLIAGIDEWVIEQSLKRAAAWHARGEAARVAVNVSPITLLRPTFARRVRALLDAEGLPASHLDIEIRETALLADPKAAQESLAELALLGVGLVLDDFGSGDSSLGHLRDHPIRAIKIDRCLVRDLPQHAAHAGMVEGLALMARSLRIDVIAKGVESEEQRRFFREVGCRAGQGFLFGAALPRELFEQRLLAHAA